MRKFLIALLFWVGAAAAEPDVEMSWYTEMSRNDQKLYDVSPGLYSNYTYQREQWPTLPSTCKKTAILNHRRSNRAFFAGDNDCFGIKLDLKERGNVRYDFAFGNAEFGNNYYSDNEAFVSIGVSFRFGK